MYLSSTNRVGGRRWGEGGRREVGGTDKRKEQKTRGMFISLMGYFSKRHVDFSITILKGYFRC